MKKEDIVNLNQLSVLHHDITASINKLSKEGSIDFLYFSPSPRLQAMLDRYEELNLEIQNLILTEGTQELRKRVNNNEKEFDTIRA